MGKYRGKKGNKQQQQQPARDDRDDKPRGSASVDKNNAAFEQYYRDQGILPESEWPAFMQTFREDLPTTFRVTGSRALAQDLNNVIKRTYVPFLSGIEFEGQPLEAPKTLSWYPGDLAWQINVGKSVIRKSPEFKKFQEFLVYETEAGNLSRQEAVSMIPPLLLDVKPHHYVLDMCAAPGSKSVQILEALHAADRPSGLFIANDADYKRCHMLVHQSLGRIGSPNMMVMNQDASMFVTIKGKKEVNDDNAPQPTLKFDRILTDVPCSGDATLRKNLAIWSKWGPGDGIGLHPLQLRILLRGIQNLKPGGRLVYSTCSLNPIENEAVVSAALSAHSDLSLVDVSEQLPLLKRRPGLTSWKVFNTDLVEVEKGSTSWNQEGNNKKPVPSLWPVGDEEQKHLERCLRIYPHDQDTGGFFVAVIQKAGQPEPEKKAAPSVAQETLAQSESNVAAQPSAAQPPTDTMANQPAVDPSVSDERPAKRVKVDESAEEVKASKKPQKKEKKEPKAIGLPFKEEPFFYLSPENEEVKACIDFFKLHNDFDRHTLMVRNRDGLAKRSIYATSESVRDLIEANDYARLRIVSAGVRSFTKQDGGKSDGVYPCKWRIVNEGVNFLRQYVGPERCLKGERQTLEAVLKDLYPANEKLDDAFRSHLDKLEPGSFVMQFGPDLSLGVEQPMYMPMWKAPVTVNMMVEKNEKSALSLRVFGSDITGLIDSKKQKTGKHTKDAAAADASTEPAAAADQDTSTAAAAGSEDTPM